MIIPFHVRNFINRLRQEVTSETAEERLAPRRDPLASLRLYPLATASTVRRLWERLAAHGVPATAREVLAGPDAPPPEAYGANIENVIGTVRVPVGVIGPLRINGVHAHGDFFVPLATTEATLVASYGRGAIAAGRAGGIAVATLADGVLRTPAFRFLSLVEAGRFVVWAADNVEALTAAAEATTRFGKLISLEPTIDGELVYLRCRYSTGDAAGQNMVTFATDALCRAIERESPIKPQSWFLEGNFSGDKKASFLGVTTGRGRRVSAQVDIPGAIIEEVLGLSVARILEYGRIANLGSLMSGQMGAQAHYANGLAALYLATGQDVACVAESAVGFTRMEGSASGLLVSVTLPNIMVGTVGGGTALPTQAAGLDILGLRGPGKAAALAEVTAAVCLCGELSLTAAVAAGQFCAAHRRLARRTP